MLISGLLALVSSVSTISPFMMMSNTISV